MSDQELGVSYREYDTYKTALDQRLELLNQRVISDVNNLHTTIRDHFADDIESFRKIQHEMNGFSDKIEKISESTMAVAQSQNRIELTLFQTDKDRKEAGVQSEKVRTRRLAALGLILTVAVPVITVFATQFAAKFFA